MFRKAMLGGTVPLLLVLTVAPLGAQGIARPVPPDSPEPAAPALTFPSDRRPAPEVAAGLVALLGAPQGTGSYAAVAAWVGGSSGSRQSRLLAAAGELIEQQKWVEAVQALQAILDASEDSLVSVTRAGPDGKPMARMVSSRLEAQRLLAALPEAGRAEYQNRVGDDAAQRLAQAKQLADPQLLADVARRYFYSTSGPEAVTLLATHHLNRDEPLLAALWFARLFERVPAEQASPSTLYRAALAFTRAGDKEKGEALWKQATGKLQKDGGLKINQQFVPLKQLREELDKAGKAAATNVVNWPICRGDAARTGAATGGAPFLEPIWTSSTLPIKADVKNWTEDNIKTAVNWHDQRGQPILHAFFLIVVNGKAIYRNYDGVYALNLQREGKLAWYSYTDGGLMALLTDPNKKAYIDQWNQQFYRQHGPFGTLFENSMTGTLSSDGKRVLVVDDLALPPHPYLLRNFAFGGGQPTFGSLTDMVSRNSLKAYLVDSGKLIWELGGRFDKDDPAKGTKASELAGSYFLAPPLPLDGKLYVLVDKQSELRLACLEALDTADRPAQPKVLWTQTLALTKEKMLFDFRRRIHAAHLAHGNGVLVCPTNTGAIIGVDLLTRNLLWAYS
jgi:hypothetical protein